MSLYPKFQLALHTVVYYIDPYNIETSSEGFIRCLRTGPRDSVWKRKVLKG
jgi:hypothetical protein